MHPAKTFYVLSALRLYVLTASIWHLQEEVQALKQQLGELEADHKAAIAAHSALEEHLDSQAAAEKELAALRCAHAELEAGHAQAIAAHAALEERLSPMDGLQRSHASLQVCCRSAVLPSPMRAATSRTQCEGAHYREYRV